VVVMGEDWLYSIGPWPEERYFWYEKINLASISDLCKMGSAYVAGILQFITPVSWLMLNGKAR
jgi:hypothetical protein